MGCISLRIIPHDTDCTRHTCNKASMCRLTKSSGHLSQCFSRKALSGAKGPAVGPDGAESERHGAGKTPWRNFCNPDSHRDRQKIKLSLLHGFVQSRRQGFGR